FLQGEQSIALIGFAPTGLTQHRGTLTVRIRIVADCGALSCQDKRKLKRATAL
ncbi:MAG: hypothetical protein JEY97_11055, partial [Bacteroidales bacterium]|nr:hypothetical protein [Bacteroidales bacterium]